MSEDRDATPKLIDVSCGHCWALLSHTAAGSPPDRSEAALVHKGDGTHEVVWIPVRPRDKVRGTDHDGFYRA